MLKDNRSLFSISNNCIYLLIKIIKLLLLFRQIALKALSERLSKDHTKPWQQDRTKKHSPIPPAISIPIPESSTPKPLASPLIPQVNVNIHNHPSTNT